MDNGKACRILRSIRNMTIKELAELSGLSVSYISLIEGNKREPSQKSIYKIVKALDTSFVMFTALALSPKELERDNDENDFVVKQLHNLLFGRKPKRT